MVAERTSTNPDNAGVTRPAQRDARTTGDINWDWG